MAKQKLESKVNPDELNILIENQLHCLQSNNLSTRKSEESKLSKKLQDSRYQQEHSSVLKWILKCIVWYFIYYSIGHLILAAAGAGWIFIFFLCVWFIVSIMLTGYLFSIPTRLLEKTVITARVKCETIDSEIRRLYAKQDEVSQLLRPLIK